MSAYASFSKTSYGAQGGDESGGFFAGGSQSSQNAGGQSYRDDSLRPLTIKQILEAEVAYGDDHLKIDGQPVSNITIVGQVRGINPQSTHVSIKLHDGSGEIEIKKWLDVDKPDEATNMGFEENTHVRVWGSLKSFNDKVSVSSRVIRPVEDLNEVHYHELEALYVHLLLTKGPLGANGQPANGAGDSMFVDGGGYQGNAGGHGPDKLSGVSPLARKAFKVLSDAAPGTSEGVNIDVIARTMGLSVNDAWPPVQELAGQGIIYPTVDDETWAVLDS